MTFNEIASYLIGIGVMLWYSMPSIALITMVSLEKRFKRHSYDKHMKEADLFPFLPSPSNGHRRQKE